MLIMQLWQHISMKQMRLFNYSAQNRYVPYIWQHLLNKYLPAEAYLICHRFSSWSFNNVFPLNLLLPCLFGVFLHFMYVAAICFVTSNRSSFLKAVTRYVHFILFFMNIYPWTVFGFCASLIIAVYLA